METQILKITLEPIGLDSQIQDAIEGESEETKLAVHNKIEKVKANLNKVVSINNSPVRECRVENGNIYYYLDNGGNVEYYYPIKYATIEVDVDPESTANHLR